MITKEDFQASKEFQIYGKYVYVPEITAKYPLGYVMSPNYTQAYHKNSDKSKILDINDDGFACSTERGIARWVFSECYLIEQNFGNEGLKLNDFLAGKKFECRLGICFFNSEEYFMQNKKILRLYRKDERYGTIWGHPTEYSWGYSIANIGVSGFYIEKHLCSEQILFSECKPITI